MPVAAPDFALAEQERQRMRALPAKNLRVNPSPIYHVGSGFTIVVRIGIAELSKLKS
jgi:hypothetical protein